jgi:hypothetical protein
MTDESPSRGGGPAVMAMTLTVPSPWAEAVGATVEALRTEFAVAPFPPFEPHVSLCRPFCSLAAPETVAGAVGRALERLPIGTVRVGEVHSFRMSDGSPEVLYVAVEADWLGPANRRIVEETASFRCSDEIAAAVAGNPEFDLDAYTPHITLIIPRELEGEPQRRHAVAERAEALWRARRPHGRGFRPGEIVLSLLAVEPSAAWPPDEATPHIVRTWRVGRGGHLSDRGTVDLLEPE